MSTSETTAAPTIPPPTVQKGQQQQTAPPSESTSVDKQKDKAAEKAAIAKAKKKKKEKAKKKAKRAKKNALKTKIIVRRLPPNLPEETFMNACKRWIGDDVIDYKFYVPGKLSQSKGKENVFSRAYFHMKTMDAVVAFHQGFDGHIFLDNKGTESRAVVEFAPFQKLPKEHKNPDTRQGTIDEDPDYLKFVESLKAEENKAAEPKEMNADIGGGTQLERLENRLALVTAQTLAAEQANKPKTTPLLDHLRAQKAAQAAAKAKAQAAKAAKKKAAKEAAKIKKAKEKAAATTTTTSSTTEEGKGGEASPSSSTPAGGAKKPPRRNKKKKDQEKKETNNNDSNNINPKAPKEASGSKPNKPKSDKPKVDKSKSDKPKSDKPKSDKPKSDKPKSDKPKKPRPNKKDGSKESKNKQNNQPGKVVQILGRDNKDDSKSKGPSSSTLTSQQQRAS